jgi:hypothetical protein
MAELTDREKKLVYIHMIMHSPSGPYENMPLEVRENMLAICMKLRGIEYDQREMLDLGQAVVEERKLMMQSGIGFLDKNKEVMKHLKDFRF